MLSPEEQQNELQQKIKQHDEWVETKARASNFGAPVFFQDEPSFVKTSEDTQDERTESPLPEAIKDELETPIEENKEIAEKNITPPEPESYFAKASFDKLRTSGDRQKKASQSKPSFAKASEGTQQTPRKSQPKPPLTLAQLTQGFLNQMKNEGNHTLHMLGKKNGTPSDEQIKYERYLQRLSWCFQNSINTSKKFYFTIQHNTKIYLFFALNRDGSIKHLQIRKSSHNKQLDEFFLSAFRDASTSFPPVPHYLPNDPFTMTFIIPLEVEEPSNIRFYAGPR